MATLKISDEFSFVPAGRYLSDGEYTGERFREELLRPMLLKHNRLQVDIDGAAGYGSSFLEEAFGGLVRKGYFTAAQLRERLDIVSKEPRTQLYKPLIWNFIDAAQKE